MNTTISYSQVLRNKGIIVTKNNNFMNRTNKSIETQTGGVPLIFLKGYTYNKVIIPTKYKPKPKPIIINKTFKHKCITCNKSHYKIKKGDLDICRACYLDSQNMMICNKCCSSKKKNDFLLCFRCFCEVTGKVIDRKTNRYKNKN